MTLIHLNIPSDLETELSKLQTDLETVVITALRQYVLSVVSVANEKDLEIAAVQDNADDFLTARELDYYLTLP
jgi:hypothetical protein